MSTLVSQLVEQVQTRNVVQLGRDPSLGQFLGKGKFGQVHLALRVPGATSPLTTTFATASGLVVKMLTDVSYRDPWCLLGPDGALVYSSGIHREDTLRQGKEIARANSDMARLMQVVRIQYYVDPVRRSRIYLNAYLNEALASVAVTKVLVEPGRALGFVKCHDVWRTDRRGYFVFDRCHDNFGNLLEHMRLPDWKAFFLVVLSHLAVGQQFLQLKHHDLHLNNVFVTYLRRPRPGVPAPRHSEGIYIPADAAPVRVGVRLSPTHMYECELPLDGSAMPMISDWGMASWGTAPRVQRADLAYFSDGTTGEYSPDFDGHRGYDGALVVGNVLGRLARVPGRLPEWRWISSLLQKFLVGGGRVGTYGRMEPGYPTDIQPAVVVAMSNMFEEFRVASFSPGTLCVVDMTK